MTKYHKLLSSSEEPKPNKTIFTKFLTGCFDLTDAAYQPEDWDNVLYLGHDNFYGDVFKIWDNDDKGFILYFGTVGDEFQ